MSYRTILVLVTEDPRLDERLTTARMLAQRFGAHVLGLHVMPLPVVPLGYGEAAAYVGPELIEAQRTAAAELADRLRQRFEAAMAELAPDFAWRAIEGDAAAVAVSQARLADLVLAPQSDLRGIDLLEPDIAEHLAMGGGVPVLILPRVGWKPDPGRRVLVAWNGSRQATRALHDALPLLAHADRVTLLAAGEAALESADDAVALLGRHGIEVEAEKLAEAGQPIGALLLARAAERDCDTLVMGAYGHSRLRELVLGGTTRHVFAAAELVVLASS